MNGAQHPNGATCAEWIRRATVDAVAEQRGQAGGTLRATLVGSEAGEIPVSGDCGRPSEIRLVEQTYPGIQFVQGDAEALSFADS
jgi:hypothetical protein